MKAPRAVTPSASSEPKAEQSAKPALIRVLIIDEQSPARDAMLHTLTAQEDMELAGLADSPVAAGDQVRKARADVVLLGWPASSPHSQRLFSMIQEARTTIRVIMLTSDEKQEDFFEAVKQGCCGLLPKKASSELLVKSIRKVHAGEFWLDRMTTADLIRKLAKKTSGAGARPGIREQSAALSQREREIVILVAQGFKNKEMAERMFISEQTVKNHLHNVFDKLGVSDRLELALYAIHHNLHEN
jgi:DNA-binding NarL/FixJ family response regulator